MYVLAVTTTPSAWSGTERIVKESSRVRTALGLHPQIAHERKAELALFEQLLPQVRYVGEIGLDGGPELRSHWLDQLKVFTSILGLCQQAGGRVMSIHSRRAATAVLDAIEQFPGAGVPMLHWFSGSQRELSRAIEMGCWFSVGPAMLVGAKGRSLVAQMPRDRVLTETDGPFAQVDGTALLPWDVDTAVRALADLWDESETLIARQLSSNLRKIVQAAT